MPKLFQNLDTECGGIAQVTDEKHVRASLFRHFEKATSHSRRHRCCRCSTSHAAVDRKSCCCRGLALVIAKGNMLTSGIAVWARLSAIADLQRPARFAACQEGSRPAFDMVSATGDWESSLPPCNVIEDRRGPREDSILNHASPRIWRRDVRQVADQDALRRSGCSSSRDGMLACR